MGLTSWYSFSTNEVLTSAKMNEQLRDNGRWLSHHATGGAPMCRVYNSATSTGVGSGVAITFDSERFDLGAMHSTVSNTSRITVPTGGGGIYLIGAHVRYAYTYDGAGTGDCGIQIVVNGTTTIAVQKQGGIVNSTNPMPSVVTLYRLVAADYVEVHTTFTEASNVDITASSNYSPEFWATWIGE